MVLSTFGSGDEASPEPNLSAGPRGSIRLPLHSLAMSPCRQSSSRPELFCPALAPRGTESRFSMYRFTIAPS